MLHKHYGGINFFEDLPTFLMAQCLENAVKKEQEIPKMLSEVVNSVLGKKDHFSGLNLNKNMRSADEIMKDYGLK